MVPEEAWEEVILGYILLPRELGEVGASCAAWTEEELEEARQTAERVVRELRSTPFHYDPDTRSFRDDPLDPLLGRLELPRADSGDGEEERMSGEGPGPPPGDGPGFGRFREDLLPLLPPHRAPGPGVPPEAIWASTFTRKAAAEILERVLLRLARGALDDAAARELAEAAWLGPGSDPPADFLTRDHCGRLLSELVFSLHRANIGTLDSFFVQVATTFARELGLSPAWRMVDGPEEDRMRSEALEAVLNQKDSAVMAELVRIMAKGDVHRGVHGRLLEQVEELLATQREVGPGCGRRLGPSFPQR